jgi:bifunctional NMN adenylyltransferase/nudix hydrolase
MIVSAYSPEVTPRLHMYPIEDVPYNDTQWVKQVYETINHAVLTATNDNRNFWASGWNDIHVGLIGCKKDETSYYLDMFPRLRSENVPAVDPEEMLSSTDIRKVFFGQASADQIDRSTVPLPTLRFLHAFSKTERFKTLVEEYRWHEKYRENVKQFPRIEHTVDSVVIQSGYILLVTRKDTPGKGMLAMPGGFLNPKERLLDGAIRELREETKLKVPEPVLRGSLVTSATYDDPNRSERGRLITNAYLFRLNPSFDLPKVKGSDDAAKAEWVALSDLNPLDFFEDHYYIIQDLIRKGGV